MLTSKLKISSDKICIDKMFVKTVLVSDYPQDAVAGILNVILNSEYLKSGVVRNFAIHFRPSTLKFNMSMNNRLKRLQKNVKSLDNGEITSSSRPEEVKALKSLLFLREREYVDLWITVTFSSLDEKLLDRCVKNFSESIGYKDWSVNLLPKEQHNALQAAWMGGGNNSIFERYPGRVVDIEAIAALYPFLSGTISDNSGCYIGHRITDCKMVYKDFTIGPDNQTMIVVGSSDEGKSTFIKGLIISLLEAGFKVYVFDVDGEYYSVCKEVGGTWVDYTSGTGLYVDPTIIEPSILKEINARRLDAESLKRAQESDAARYNEAVSNVRALVSMLSDDFNVKKRNALGKALTQMWESAGIYKNNPETWELRSPEVGLRQLYFRIKANGEAGDEDAKNLKEDLWTYFEGNDSDLFSNADTGEWIRNSQLTVFHVASSADDIADQQMGAIKIVATNHMVWQQIKRDRIKKEHYSGVIYDEWQRLRKNPYARAPVYRIITTGRKFNAHAVLGFNDPSVIKSEDGGQGMWDNSKYKVLFRLEENSIREIAKSANMPDEILNHWLNLPKYSFIFRQRAGGRDIYDILRMEFPKSELTLSKTRGLD